MRMGGGVAGGRDSTSERGDLLGDTVLMLTENALLNKDENVWNQSRQIRNVRRTQNGK